MAWFVGLFVVVWVGLLLWVGLFVFVVLVRCLLICCFGTGVVFGVCD